MMFPIVRQGKSLYISRVVLLLFKVNKNVYRAKIGIGWAIPPVRWANLMIGWAISFIRWANHYF